MLRTMYKKTWGDIEAKYIEDQAFGDDEYYFVRLSKQGEKSIKTDSYMGGFPYDSTVLELLLDKGWITPEEHNLYMLELEDAEIAPRHRDSIGD